MSFRAIVPIILLSSAAATMFPQSATAQETDEARTARRVQELTAFRNSQAYARVAAIQNTIGSITSAKELFDLHNSIDISQEQSKLSPTTELYFLLKAEVVFAQLRNPGGELIAVPDALEQLQGFGQLRRQEVEDPTIWLEYQILSGMYALQKNQKVEAESHLKEFDDFTRPFNVKGDAAYVTQMRQAISSGDREGARRAFSERLALFFPQHFSEVTDSFDNKIKLMKAMTEKR